MFEILGRKFGVALKVVVKTGVGGGADAELGFGKELKNGGCEQMRGGVPVDLQCFGIFGGQNLQVGVDSMGRVRSNRSPFTRATIASAASRGLMEFAISSGRVPAGTV